MNPVSIVNKDPAKHRNDRRVRLFARLASVGLSSMLLMSVSLAGPITANQKDVPANPSIPVSVWKAPAPNTEYFVRVSPTSRLSATFITDLDALKASLASKGAIVDDVLAGTANLYLRFTLPQQTLADRQVTLSGIEQLPLVANLISGTAANLMLNDRASLTEYSPSSAIVEARLRGFRLKRTSALPDLSKPHTNEILVKLLQDSAYTPALLNTTLTSLALLHSQLGTSVKQKLTSADTPILVISVPTSANYAAVLMAYQDSPFVEYAEPNLIIKEAATPNDPGYSPTFSTSTPNEYDMALINAPTAWNTTTSSGNVVVSVMDTGIDYNNLDIENNLWPSANSGASCGFNEVGGSTPLDDNIYGKDSNGNPITTNEYHGTQVSGIIGAVGNNGLGTAGVCWSTHLMAVKVLDSYGSGTTQSIYNGYSDVFNNGGGVVNASFAEPANSQSTSLTGQYQALASHGIPLAKAAGNDGQNRDTWTMDQDETFLASNILYVGASDQNDSTQNTSFTNYGQYSVDLFAPGNSVWSTWGGNNTGNYVEPLSGTSQATPHITGALALIRSSFPWESASELADRIRFSVDPVPALSNLCWTGGRLDVANALGPRPRLSNISTRCYVPSSSSATAGFIIVGDPNQTKTVVIRGLGPTLAGYGIPNYLPNPKLTLFNGSGSVIDSNDDWQNLPSSSQQVLQNNSLTPQNASESALVETLPPGTYTVQIADDNGAGGVGLVECYDVDGSSRNRFDNISTLAYTSSGTDVETGGFWVDDSGGGFPRTVFIHAYGPSLGAYGVSNPLPDPVLTVFDSNGNVIATNQGWTNLPAALQARIRHGGLGSVSTPGNSADSALVLRLKPGGYTAQISGASGDSGNSLIEVDEF